MGNIYLYLWIAIAIFIIAITITLMNLKGFREINEETYGMLWVPAGILILGFFVIICVQIFDIIECNVFPEKVLYDFIKTMLNQNS